MADPVVTPATQPQGPGVAAPAATTKRAKAPRTTEGRGLAIPFTVVRIGMGLAALLHILGLIVFLGGLSAVQKRNNDLNLGNHFGLYWWFLVLEVLLMFAVVPLLISRPLLGNLRLVSVALLVYALVLATNAADTFRDTFGRRGSATLAGAVLLAISNIVSIILLATGEGGDHAHAGTTTGTTSVV